MGTSQVKGHPRSEWLRWITRLFPSMLEGRSSCYQSCWARCWTMATIMTWALPSVLYRPNTERQSNDKKQKWDIYSVWTLGKEQSDPRIPGPGSVLVVLT